jgi:anti-sigma factor RsiW
MLRCQQVAELLSDELDGRVSWRQRLAMRLHLAMCGACRRYAQQLRLTVEALRALGRGPSLRATERAHALRWWAHVHDTERGDTTDER